MHHHFIVFHLSASTGYPCFSLSLSDGSKYSSLFDWEGPNDTWKGQVHELYALLLHHGRYKKVPHSCTICCGSTTWSPHKYSVKYIHLRLESWKCAACSHHLSGTHWRHQGSALLAANEKSLSLITLSSGNHRETSVFTFTHLFYTSRQTEWQSSQIISAANIWGFCTFLIEKCLAMSLYFQLSKNSLLTMYAITLAATVCDISFGGKMRKQKTLKIQPSNTFLLQGRKHELKFRT